MTIKCFFKNNLKYQVMATICTLLLSVPLFCIISYSQNVNSEEPTDTQTVDLPVLMYHLILKDSQTKNKFTISEKTFEEDLQYIQNNGYSTILVKDLIDYVDGKRELPSKPILLTFDDGAYNNYLYAFPLAKKYNMKFVFSPIAAESEKYSQIKDDNPNYAHADWECIKEMSDSGLVEIQNHTYNMHSNKNPRVGCTKKFCESEETYKQKLTEDILKAQDLIQNHTQKKPTAFFYPFGACSKCTETIIRSLGFRATFLCEGRVNKISKNPTCLFGLGRFIRPPGVSSEIFFKKLKK